jgi:hypothetical protein
MWKALDSILSNTKKKKKKERKIQACSIFSSFGCSDLIVYKIIFVSKVVPCVCVQ